MSYKGAIQIGVCVVLSVWICCALFIYDSETERNAIEQSYEAAYSSIFASTTATITESTTETTTFIITETTTAVVTDFIQNTTEITEPDDTQVTETVTQSVSEDGNESVESTENEESFVPSTVSEIITVYVDAVNTLKTTSSFTLVKTDTLAITIEDMTGASILSGIAEAVIDSNTPKTSEYYTFVNGSDSATGETPNSVIAPLNMSAALSESGVLSATASETASGGYTVTIYLVDELQTLSAPATNHVTSVEVVDLDAVGVPSGADVTTLDIIYSGTIIQAEFDSEGRIISMYHELPVYDAYADGSYLFITAFAQISGLYTSTYQIAY